LRVAIAAVVANLALSGCATSAPETDAMGKMSELLESSRPFDECFSQHGDEGVGTGHLQMILRIGVDGRVEEGRIVEASTDSPKFKTCAIQAAKAQLYPPRNQAEEIKFSYRYQKRVE
jgi:hypothetical protein